MDAVLSTLLAFFIIHKSHDTFGPFGVVHLVHPPRIARQKPAHSTWRQPKHLAPYHPSPSQGIAWSWRRLEVGVKKMSIQIVSQNWFKSINAQFRFTKSLWPKKSLRFFGSSTLAMQFLVIYLEAIPKTFSGHASRNLAVEYPWHFNLRKKHLTIPTILSSTM